MCEALHAPESPRAGLDLAAYAGRWVALLNGRVVGQGGTPEQARRAALSRFKEVPEVQYVPMSSFSLPYQSPALHLMRRIAEALPADVPVYLVGGTVRDLLLGREIHDWDFTLPGNALRVARWTADQLGGAYFPLDEEHDTGRVIWTDDTGRRVHLDFAGMRGVILEDDLRARDFTINALAVDVRHPQEIYDPLGGANDLQAGLLRVCGPDALNDDPLRVLRGIRQAAAMNLKIAPETRALMKSAAPGLVRISSERLRDEMFRILDGARPEACLRALDILGVLPYVLPELSRLKGETQPAPHVKDVWEHTLDVLRALGDVLAVLAPEYDEEKAANLAYGLVVKRLGRFRQPLSTHLGQALNTDRPLRPLLFLAALYHDIAKPQTRKIDESGQLHFYEHDALGADMASKRAQQLHLSNQEMERVALVVRHHMRPAHLMRLHLAQAGTVTPRAIYRFFRDTGPAGVDICLLSLADFLATYGATLPQEAWAQHLEIVRSLLEAWWEHPQQAVKPPSLINGHDLIQSFHLLPGPQIGQLLEAVREAQAEGQVNDREQALALVGALLAGGANA